MTAIIVGEVGDILGKAALHLGKGCPTSWERLPYILEKAARHLGRGCPTSWEKIGGSRKNDGYQYLEHQKTGRSNFSAKIRQ